MALINRRTIQNNWKLWAALGLTGLAALGVGLTCAFFPPAIPAIAGISIFGFKAFAGLTTMSVVAASFSGAGIAAAATLIGAGLINGLTKVSNLFDNLFKTKKTHVTDMARESIVPTFDPRESSSTKLYGHTHLKRNTHRHESKHEAANDEAPRVEVTSAQGSTVSPLRIPEQPTTAAVTTNSQYVEPVRAVKKHNLTTTTLTTDKPEIEVVDENQRGFGM
ncbi:Uncharacterised protein [Legionella beliardensis]|uniref:Transmembrane protein n=1 Tax=Legionella beliardensis TaxID=91822 RepID=A0A378I625_9GAMM|nr:US12 family protein [Legionella beliardensis]STX30210.1 Uncharacterised protein [Legionella beliardensis]